MGKHTRHRLVRTILPVDGVFRFIAVARAEGDGLRVTVPAPIARGLAHVGAGLGPRDGGVKARFEGGAWFNVWLRTANSRQVVMVLPLAHRGATSAGDRVMLEVAVVADATSSA